MRGRVMVVGAGAVVVVAVGNVVVPAPGTVRALVVRGVMDQPMVVRRADLATGESQRQGA